MYYYSFIICACIISYAGFVTGNTSVLLGSMLVSPLFQPINQIVQNNTLLDGYITLSISLALCVLAGYVLHHLVRNEKETQEMISVINWKKGNKDYFLTFVVPTICGVVLALAMKQKDHGSIFSGVGLAISILPPLVLSGVYLAKKEMDKSKVSFQLALVNVVCFGSAYYFTNKWLLT